MSSYVRCKYCGHLVNVENHPLLASRKLRAKRKGSLKAVLADVMDGSTTITDEVKELALKHWTKLLTDYDGAYEHEFNFLFSNEGDMDDVLGNLSSKLDYDSVNIDFDTIDPATVKFHVDVDEEHSDYIKQIVENLKKKYTGIIEFDNYGRGNRDNFVRLSTFNNDEIAGDLEDTGLRAIEFQVEGKPDGTRYSNGACHAEFLLHFTFKNFNTEAEEEDD